MRRVSLGSNCKQQTFPKKASQGKLFASAIVLVSIISLGAFLLVACGGGSSSTPTTGGTSGVSAAVDTFATVGDDVRTVTPALATAANTSLDEWADWRELSIEELNDDDTLDVSRVLDKLLSDSAESVFAPADFLGELMQIVDLADESDTGVWDEAGTITVTGENPDSGQSVEMSITVSLVEDVIALPPFFQDKVPSSIQTSMADAITRIITFIFPDETTGWDTTVALGEDDAYYYLVASSAHATLLETRTFIAYMDRSTSTMTLYFASSDDEGAGVYTKWSGNMVEDWFSIAQVTNAHGGNQEVVGGGTMTGSGSIAFKSRNKDDANDSSDVYYLAELTTVSILDNIDPGVAPQIGEPDSGTGSIEYIIESNEKCLGWCGKNKSPATRLDLAWSPIE